MTVENALKFIRRGQIDKKLLDRLNGADCASQLQEALEEEGLRFTPEQFAEAFTDELLKCQFKENADRLNAFKQWWDVLHGFLGATAPSSCASGCSGCG